jgi:hypothetical protein
VGHEARKGLRSPQEATMGTVSEEPRKPRSRERRFSRSGSSLLVNRAVSSSCRLRPPSCSSWPSLSVPRNFKNRARRLFGSGFGCGSGSSDDADADSDVLRKGTSPKAGKERPRTRAARVLLRQRQPRSGTWCGSGSSPFSRVRTDRILGTSTRSNARGSSHVLGLAQMKRARTFLLRRGLVRVLVPPLARRMLTSFAFPAASRARSGR